MNLIGLSGSVRAKRALGDRWKSVVQLWRAGVRAAAQPWRWAPVLAIPLLFTGHGAQPWREVHPPPSAAASVTAPDAPAGEFDGIAPVAMDARVERWVNRFRTDDRDEFQQILDREGIYGGLIRSKLKQRGMPSDLLYLAMMESGLLPRAVSNARAVGLWQLMVPTARQYGLRVDRWVDERRDPVRATDAALDYLQALHRRYGSWYLAAAAYNAGPGRVDRAIDRYAGGRTDEKGVYWKVIGHLPLETRNYVPRMLAATYLARDARKFGFETNEVAPYQYDRVFVPARTSLASVARTVGVKTSVLGSLNPQLIRGVTPPAETYPVRVPLGTAGAVVALLDTGRKGDPTS